MIKVPGILKNLFPDLIWEVREDNFTNTKNIYLTFDDGPTPEITEYVLNLLSHYEAKATFFLVGNNVDKYYNIYKKIKVNNHSIGNHTFHHLNGWKTPNETYFNDIAKCNQLINSKIFRPPHGKIKPSQKNYLLNYYKIVMWSIISYDFDEKLSWKDCFSYVIKNIYPGAIIVFHDSIKASKRLIPMLPELLKVLKEMNFNFEKIVF